MVLQKIQFLVPHSQAGMRLDQYLVLALAAHFDRPVSRSRARSLVVSGGVYLNRKRVRIASKELFGGAKIEVFVNAEKFFAQVQTQIDEVSLESSDILFEDEDLICVNKWAGLPTQPTIDEARANLYALTKKFLMKRDHDGDPYLGLHHRLDRDTSGLVIFTKQKRANAGLSKLFVEHEIQKTYQCITVKDEESNIPARQTDEIFEVRNYLGPDPKSLKIKKYRSVRSGGDSALTVFKILDVSMQALKIEAQPKSGRTHQIRVHLSELGLPILGDPLYGGEWVEKRAPRLMLHARVLEFRHPLTERPIRIEAAPPSDFNETLSAQKLARD